MLIPNAAAAQEVPSVRLRSVAIATAVLSLAVVSSAVVATVGKVFQFETAAPAGLPACRVAERPAKADRYDQWAVTLLDPAHTLGRSYVPPDLRLGITNGDEVVVREFVVQPLTEMLDAAAADGIVIRVTSSYRSYADQLALMTSNPDDHDLIALPGHSEHQLGTTVDLADGDEWLAANAPHFGFVMSFPPDRSPEWTCYRTEPWHFRYFGADLAAKITASGLSPREYLWLHQ